MHCQATGRNDDRKLVDGQKVGHLRQGLVGDWRSMFTAEQSALYDRVINESLADLPGLEFDLGQNVYWRSPAAK
jgi:hypothetical protein